MHEYVKLYDKWYVQYVKQYVWYDKYVNMQNIKWNMTNYMTWYVTFGSFVECPKPICTICKICKIICTIWPIWTPPSYICIICTPRFADDTLDSQESPSITPASLSDDRPRPAGAHGGPLPGVDSAMRRAQPGSGWAWVGPGAALSHHQQSGQCILCILKSVLHILHISHIILYILHIPVKIH